MNRSLESKNNLNDDKSYFTNHRYKRKDTILSKLNEKTRVHLISTNESSSFEYSPNLSIETENIHKSKIIQQKNKKRFYYKRYLKDRFKKMIEIMNNSYERYKHSTLDLSLP